MFLLPVALSALLRVEVVQLLLLLAVDAVRELLQVRIRSLVEILPAPLDLPRWELALLWGLRWKILMGARLPRSALHFGLLLRALWILPVPLFAKLLPLPLRLQLYFQPYLHQLLPQHQHRRYFLPILH